MLPATSKTALANTTVLTPAQYEHSKTRQQKAEDIIYTLNHSITCLSITDTVGLSGAANAYNLIFKPKNKLNLDHEHNNGYGAFSWVWDNITGKHKDGAYVHKIGHEEDHRIEHELEHAAEHAAEDIAKGRKPHIHPDPVPKLTPADSFGRAGKKFVHTSAQWLMAEAIGDIGAVPVTIALQRHAPGFMHWLRGPSEWATGWMFRSTTTKAARQWGDKHGFAADSQEVKGRQQELYQYEMNHMPQMAVWTVTSIAMNFGAMVGLNKVNPHMFERTSLEKFAKVKGLGALFTAAVVLSVRGLIPGGAHKWDQTVGRNVVIPITKKAGRLFGVRESDVDRFQQNREQMESGLHHLTQSEAPKIEEIPTTPRLTVQGGHTADMSVERLQAPIEQAAIVS